MTTRNDNDQNRAADEAARTARTVTDEAARVGEQSARAGADIARRSTETARDTFQTGLNTASETFQRVTDQFTQVLGFNGPQSEELARRSSQNLQAVSQASTVLARGAQEVSREVIQLVQDRLQKNLDAVNRLAGTRSVQDFVAVQRALVRNSGGGRRAGRWTRFQAMRCDAGIPSRVIRFSTAQRRWCKIPCFGLWLSEG